MKSLRNGCTLAGTRDMRCTSQLVSPRSDRVLAAGNKRGTERSYRAAESVLVDVEARCGPGDLSTTRRVCGGTLTGRARASRRSSAPYAASAPADAYGRHESPDRAVGALADSRTAGFQRVVARAL